MKPETVFHHLRPINIGKISWNFYILIREGQEWPHVDKSAIGLHRNGNPKSIVAREVNGDNSIVFESMGTAAKHFGLKDKTLRMHIQRNGSKQYHGWRFFFIDDKTIQGNKSSETSPVC